MNVCISNLFFFEFLLILKSNNGHIGQSNPIYDHFFQYLSLSRWSLLERCRYSLWVIFSILSYWRTRVNTPAEKSLLRFCSLSLALFHLYDKWNCFIPIFLPLMHRGYALRYFSKVRTNSYVCMKTFTESFALFHKSTCITYLRMCARVLVPVLILLL